MSYKKRKFRCDILWYNVHNLEGEELCMIGETLKIIRESRGISQRDFSKNVVSPSFYSKVEAGTSQISASLLFALLEDRNVTIKEFYYIKKRYKNEQQTTILQQTRMAFHKADLPALETLYQNVLIEQLDENYLFVIKNLKHYIRDEPFDQVDLRALKKYLLEIPGWGHYEFQLFSLCSYLFDADTLTLLASNVVRTIDRYAALSNYEQDLLTILINLARALLKESRASAASHYLQLAKNYQKNPLLIYEQLLIDFFEQVIQLKTGATTNSSRAIYIIDMFMTLHLNQTAQKLEVILAE